MVLYLFTLGFHADHVIRRLVRAQNIEDIKIVTARPVVRAVQQAFQEITAFCERSNYPIPKLVEIDLSDTASAIYRVYREVSGYRQIVADLGGGMRPVIVSTLLALLIASTKSDILVYVSGEREDAPEITVPLTTILTVLFRSLSNEKKKILEHIEKNPGITRSELAEALGRSERTVRAHLAELKRLRFIVEEKNSVRSTPWAQLYLACEYSEITTET